MDAYLDRPRAGPRRRPSTCRTIHSVASFFVSRVDTEVDKRLDAIGTDEADGAARARPPSPTPGSPTRRSRRSSPATAGERCAAGRRQPAAPAVGLDRRQEPGLPRHAVRHRAGRRRHRQHDAREDHGRLRRPRRGHRGHGHRPRPTRRRQVFDRLEAVGIDFDDVLQVARARGRRQVQEVVDRAGRDRVSGQMEKAGKDQA